MKCLLPFLILFYISSSDSIPQQDTKYVGSKNSDKYHLTSCQWAEKISPKNLVEFRSIEEAENAGYIPCKVCKPSTLKSVNKTTKKQTLKSETKYSSGRCLATTKKGTQCKRKVQAGSNYCWQHQR